MKPMKTIKLIVQGQNLHSFRKYLEREEESIEHLEQKLERTLKLCTGMIDSGKEYVKNQR